MSKYSATQQVNFTKNSDPDTQKIRLICQSLIGCEIQIGFNIKLKNGENHSGKINNCNIVGDCMENILFPFIQAHIPTFEEGPKQASPDFYNREKKWEYEMKCFCGGPSFDVSNFTSYIAQLSENLERKMYKTQYLIFKYEIKNGYITITNFKLCNVWGILNYGGKRPVSLQVKKNVWYNIRPCTFNDMNNPEKTQEIFIKQICKAIDLCPNNIENSEQIKISIMTQFIQLTN
jgi:hypothetical protein